MSKVNLFKYGQITLSCNTAGASKRGGASDRTFDDMVDRHRQSTRSSFTEMHKICHGNRGMRNKRWRRACRRMRHEEYLSKRRTRCECHSCVDLFLSRRDLRMMLRFPGQSSLVGTKNWWILENGYRFHLSGEDIVSMNYTAVLRANREDPNIGRERPST
jgi:hypothetical protein